MSSFAAPDDDSKRGGGADSSDTAPTTATSASGGAPAVAASGSDPTKSERQLLAPLSFEDLNAILIAKLGKINGIASEGDQKYDSIMALWSKELTQSATVPGKLEWYNSAFNYWESEDNCPISDDGVLGGYGALTPEDVKGSNAFLTALTKIRPGLELNRAADCGAGIGRVAKNFLLSRFAHVDLVEQSPRLLASAAKYLGEEFVGRTTFIEQGLQDFSPEPNTYDVIWIQWVIGHLHDLDFISFFRRVAKSLTPNGVIVLKDNCCTKNSFVLDEADRSISRKKEYMTCLLELAGMNILKVEKQKNFPDELYPVVMFAMCPIPPLP